MLETVICTISDEGTRRKNELIEETMQQLGKIRSSKVRVVGVHMGEDSQMKKIIADYCPEIHIISIPAGNFLQKAKIGMRNLFINAKKIIRDTALNDNPLAIIYTEGDKRSFVSEISRIVTPLLEGKADVVIPARSREGFNQFPLAQRYWESAANSSVSKITGTVMDRMYGPRAWDRECALFFGKCILNDFGALTYSVVRAELEGKRVISLEVPGFPQRDYMLKYALPFRMPVLHFLYRAIQNLPHKYASRLAKLDVNAEKINLESSSQN